MVLHQPLNKGCVAIVSLTLDPVSLSGNSALGKAKLDVVGVSGAEDDDGGAKDNEEEPGRGGQKNMIGLTSFCPQGKPDTLLWRCGGRWQR